MLLAVAWALTALALVGCMSLTIRVPDAIRQIKATDLKIDHRRNPRALTAIYHNFNAADWKLLTGEHNWSAYYAPDEDAIYVRAEIPDEAWTLVHEYEHYLEQRLRHDPTAVRIIRHAFRDLNGGGFEIGRDDLMKEIE